MVVVSVFHPDRPAGRLDLHAYLTSHIPLVCQHGAAHGLLDLRILRGAGTPAAVPRHIA